MFFGTLVRVVNNFDKLKALLKIFENLVTPSLEVVHACEEALDIIRRNGEPEKSFPDVPSKSGTGYGAIEAPGGMGCHRYHQRNWTCAGCKNCRPNLCQSDHNGKRSVTLYSVPSRLVGRRVATSVRTGNSRL